MLGGQKCQADRSLISSLAPTDNFLRQVQRILKAAINIPPDFQNTALELLA